MRSLPVCLGLWLSIGPSCSSSRDYAAANSGGGGAGGSSAGTGGGSGANLSGAGGSAGKGAVSSNTGGSNTATEAGAAGTSGPNVGGADGGVSTGGADAVGGSAGDGAGDTSTGTGGKAIGGAATGGGGGGKATGGAATGGGGGSPSTGGSTGSGGTSGPRCGDGTVNSGEECDNGANNGPGKACNANCKLNVCGDGDVGPGEGCDKGSANGLELLRCAPDCSRIIEAKHIVVADSELPNSNLQPNPVAKADATCKVGYKAFFAYGSTRRATTSALAAVNSLDWVIRPYTYYYNERENPVWLTDSVPLLGVRGGRFVGLQNDVSQTTYVILTGLNPDYTTLGTNNCNGWSTISTGYSKHYGIPLASDVAFMYSEDLIECGSYTVSFYCVEQ